MATIELPSGTIHYDEVGPADGRPVVCVHGYLMGRELWAGLAERLAARGLRVLAPTWPLGAHPVAVSEPTVPGVVKTIAAFLDALDLDDVVLLGNDTGGALCQLVVTRHPERVGRLVLTPCDAYENFLPPAFRYLQLLARVPGGVAAVAQTMRIPAARRSPLAYGWLAKHPIPSEVLERWTAPVRTDRRIRADVAAVLRGISNRYTLEAATRLREFSGPTLLAWATEDRFFKPRFAERLAADIPGARLEWIEDARTFVSEDQPQRLTGLLRDFTLD